MITPMAILAYGINHKSAPLSIREKWGFNQAQTAKILDDIKQHTSLQEAVLLSTCNRTEIYTPEHSKSELQQWLSQQPDHHELQEYAYAYSGIKAISHLMRVASGLDSAILGEPQIFGQLKRAYEISDHAGLIGKHFRHYFPSIFSTGKRIRHQTGIARAGTSLAYVVVQIAKRIFSCLKTCSILLIGSGEMISLIATHFYRHNPRQLIIAGRNREQASQLAAPYQATAIHLSEMTHYLPSVEIVVSATTSQSPILGKEQVRQALRQKKRRPFFMADLAVPRDIDPEVATLHEDIYLYNIDELQHQVVQNLKSYESAVKQAEEMIALQAEHYLKQSRILNASTLITDYRQKITAVSQNELQKAIADLQRGRNPEAVLHSLTHHLTRKIMHTPTMKLRQASYENKTELLLAFKQLFDL